MKRFLYQTHWTIPESLPVDDWGPTMLECATMREAAGHAAVCQANRSKIGEPTMLYVYVADPDGPKHPNGLPICAHRFDCVVSPQVSNSPVGSGV